MLRKGVLRMIKGIGPRDEIEGMLAVQMAGLHNAAMECQRRGMRQREGNSLPYFNQSAKLSQTFVKALDALNRHRGKGQQQIKVEHVHVNKGGQAIVGAVSQGGALRSEPQERAATERLIENRPEGPIWSADLEREPVPVHVNQDKRLTIGSLSDGGKLASEAEGVDLIAKVRKHELKRPMQRDDFEREPIPVHVDPGEAIIVGRVREGEIATEFEGPADATNVIQSPAERAMRGADPRREPVSVAAGHREAPVSDAWRGGGERRAAAE
jgi:hypothetical protein